MSAMPEIARSPPPRDWATRIQIHGVLQKKPFGHQSNKWAKRFFLVKDGFLMYYGENERKEYEKREFFNIHPKGIIPLGECRMVPLRDSGHPFCLQIDSHEIDGRLMLAAETEYERDRWLNIMERSRRVTWQNTHLSDEMIRQLENDGLDMAREKQDYFDRLQSEVQALSEERIRADELERINSELENEKKKLEEFTSEIQEEYERIRSELQDTASLMREFEDEKRDLNETLHQQSRQLSSLAEDKEKVMKELGDREKMASQLSQEKRHLSETTDELRQRLDDIEKQTESIKAEKKQAQEKLHDNLERLMNNVGNEMRLHDNLEKLMQLQEEKSSINEHAEELQSTIHDLKAQKEMTEKELKEEIRARLLAEQRLREAESSLKKLDRAVQNQTPNIEADIKQEMTVNVKKLKQFFEDLATESKISSDKPLIMRNTLTARKTMIRRAKTVKFENRKQSSTEEEIEISALEASNPNCAMFMTMVRSANSPTPTTPPPSPGPTPTSLRVRATTCIDRETRTRQRRAVTSAAPGPKHIVDLPASPLDKIVYEEHL